jgi:hypothetical protein
VTVPSPGEPPTTSDLQRQIQQLREDVLLRMEDISQSLRGMVTEGVYRAEQRMDAMRMDHLEQNVARVAAELEQERTASQQRADNADRLRAEDRARSDATRRLVFTSLIGPLLVALVTVWVTAVAR